MCDCPLGTPDPEHPTNTSLLLLPAAGGGRKGREPVPRLTGRGDFLFPCVLNGLCSLTQGNPME